MAKQTAPKGASAKQVAIDVLRTAGEPLKAKEIAKRLLASGRCAGLQGKTPQATISAMLAVGSKPGGPFKRVDKGTYTLASGGATPVKPRRTSKATARTSTRKRRSTKSAKTTSRGARTRRSTKRSR